MLFDMFPIRINIKTEMILRSEYMGYLKVDHGLSPIHNCGS